MSSFNPTMLLEMLEKVRDRNLCPNRIWQTCSHIKDWPSKQSALQKILNGMFPRGVLRHEDHSACNVGFCEFSSRNFTAVQQYHEPKPYEERNQAKIVENHKQKEACFPLRGLFSDAKLVQAVKSDKLTVWSLDGLAILEHPRPFMAISHVWSDGTGTGTWPSKQVNQCLYDYFKRIAKRFHCEGIWWDTLCVPQDKNARSKALSIMHRNYEYARVTLVHDLFLRNLPFGEPDKACFAIILSSWFTRGWTALELAKSRKVKIIFKDSIKDLDEDILNKAHEGSAAAKAIKDLRRDRFSDIGDLLAALCPRYTSWLKDRATIAGLLAGIQISDTNKDTFQQDIFQSILKEVGTISHDHLFHNSVTMSKGFSWCATNLFQLPRATTQHNLRINDVGEVSGSWRLFPVDQINKTECSWGNSHELIEAKLQYALEKESNEHLLLVKVSDKGLGIKGEKKGLLVKILKSPCQGKPRFKCQFVGSLYFYSELDDNRSVTREIAIGDTEGWEQLNEDENAWHIMKENDSSPEDPKERVEGSLSSQTAKSETVSEWPELHRAAWLGDARMADIIAAKLAKLKKDDQLILLQQRDKLGRRAIHLAAERGHKVFVEMLLKKNDDPNSPIDSCLSDADYNSPDNGQTPLHRAVWGGSMETVKLLLEGGSDADITDKAGNTALHVAAAMGFEEVVEYLCKQAQGRVKAQGRNGLTPLHYAALNGHFEVARLLITWEANIDVKDRKFGWTPLHCAAENGHASVIELLLGKGAKVDETDDTVGWAPLHFAAMNGYKAAVEKLIRKANIDKEDKNGFTPLIFAAINGHAAVVETFVRYGAAINNDTFDWRSEDVKSFKTVVEWLKLNGEKFRGKISSTGWSRIYLAAMDRYTEIIRLVVDGDIDISDKRVGNGDRMLHWAAGDGRLGIVRLLVQIDTDKDFEDNHDWRPLWLAASKGHLDVVQALLEDINTEVANWLLFQAAERGYEGLVRVLLDAGANKDTEDHGRDTPLIRAAKGGHEGAVRALLEAGANTEASGDNGNTPLMWAVQEDKGEGIIRVLLEAGANTEALDRQGRTPLLQAVQEDKGEGIILALLEARANTEASGDNGNTPLMWAVQKGHKAEGIVQMLLEEGANKEVSGKHGWTPLVWAVWHKYESVVRMLLKAGASPETKDAEGNTPLLRAVQGECKGKGIVQMLLEAGANKDAKDAEGNTPLDWAVRNGHEGIIQALNSAEEAI